MVFIANWQNKRKKRSQNNLTIITVKHNSHICLYICLNFDLDMNRLNLSLKCGTSIKITQVCCYYLRSREDKRKENWYLWLQVVSYWLRLLSVNRDKQSLPGTMNNQNEIRLFAWLTVLKFKPLIKKHQLHTFCLAMPQSFLLYMHAGFPNH